MQQHKSQQQKPQQPPLNNHDDEIVESIAVVRRGGNWALCQIKTQGNRVLSKTFGEENVRAIVLEQFKILARNNYWMNH